ncbi:MAG: phosphate/phosphite/phosphonate ABC transporter substrate-binding protein, partial [Candidatus Limnocylindria bacterium]
SAGPGPAAGTAAPAGPQLGSADRPIVLAFTPSQDTQRITASGNAIAASLERATGLRWRVSVPTSYAASIEGMCASNVDAAFLAPLQMVLAIDRTCAEPILSSLRNDETGKPSATYNSQILVRSDSGINDVRGLKGKKFAFVDTISASGYLIPSLVIRNKGGEDPKTFFAANGIVFAGGHDRAVLALYNGQVDGAASFIDVRTNRGMPADIMEKTRRLDTAGPIPNDGIALRKGFPADLGKQVEDALLAYATTTEGKAALKALYTIDGLQSIDSNFYDSMRDAAKLAGIDLGVEAAKTARPVATPTPTRSP